MKSIRRQEVEAPFLFLAALRLICLAAVIFQGSFQAQASEDIQGRIDAGGRARKYLLHVPSKSPESKSALVIALHGDAGSGAQMRAISGMNDVADSRGFYVVYPTGSGWANLPPYSWNAGTCCGYAQNAQVDDVGFILKLIDDIGQRYPIDPARVYAAGISNGGMMAHRLACEASGRIAAVAVVSGTLGVSSCTPAHPRAIVMFHGTQDNYIPYAGGHGSMEINGRADPSVETVVSFWARVNRCEAMPRNERQGRILKTAYSACADSASVVLYTLEGEGHAWPGGKKGWALGQAPSQLLSASRMMWEFFAEHPAASDGESATHIQRRLIK